ncbi:type VII secretion integral membrane protein EccD [Corynebacterium heidelbergense]|uniref:Type VII secretion integral membrane protein EccD n=1 Tax=Corynebacterium heidelbergense TaxID=2055947 RepID=A0A364V705_9CORY|nr:type VII secretion integral membrane protein EccD [Corynebacterium heidelbergense]RAV32427.1 type VII secretion integral membrane protein EccD [Corynebacterium heidelbergense]
MASVFVRLSVFWNERQLDVSLPAHRPLVDLMDDVVALLAPQGVGRGPHEGASNGSGSPLIDTAAWVLSSPTAGILDPESTLSANGVVDGQRLYLTRRQEAAHSPFVDDVMAEVRHTVEDNSWRWAGRTRAAALIALSGACLVALGIPAASTLFTASTHLSQWSPAHFSCAAFLALVALSGAVLAFMRPVPLVRWAGLLLPVVAAICAWPLLRSHPAGLGIPALVSVCAVGSVVSALAAGRRKDGPSRFAGALACTIVAFLALAVGTADQFGASARAILAWCAWVPVVVLLVAPSVAVSVSGLPAMLRRNDAGETIDRQALRARAIRAMNLTQGVVWAATSIAVLIAVALGSGPYWQQGILAALLGVVLLLRSNSFSDSRLMAPLLAGGVLSLAATAGTVPVWAQEKWIAQPGSSVWWRSSADSPWECWVAAAAVVLIASTAFLVAHRREPNPLQQARTAKIISPVDTVVSLAVVPVVLVAQGVFTYYWAIT